MGIVYLIEYHDMYKIGKTKRSVHDRIKEFNVPDSYSMIPLVEHKSDRHDDLELYLHKELKHYRYNREWFRFNSRLFAIFAFRVACAAYERRLHLSTVTNDYVFTREINSNLIAPKYFKIFMFDEKLYFTHSRNTFFHVTNRIDMYSVGDVSFLSVFSEFWECNALANCSTDFIPCISVSDLHDVVESNRKLSDDYINKLNIPILENWNNNNKLLGIDRLYTLTEKDTDNFWEIYNDLKQSLDKSKWSYVYDNVIKYHPIFKAWKKYKGIKTR